VKAPKKHAKRDPSEVVVPREMDARGTYPGRREFNPCFVLSAMATSAEHARALNVIHDLGECTSIFIDCRLVCVIHETEDLAPAIVGMNEEHALNTGMGHDVLLLWYNAAGEAYLEYLRDE
jgi:hypothetical protein